MDASLKIMFTIIFLEKCQIVLNMFMTYRKRELFMHQIPHVGKV